MRRPSLLLAVGLLSAAPLADEALAAAVPPLLQRAADRYAEDVRGIVAQLEEAETHVKGPLVDRHARTRAWIVSRDGLPVQARVLTYRLGDALDEKERQRLERQINERYKTREREFQPPYAQAHLDAYRFAEAGCEGCPAGGRRFTFQSVPRDERHGDGTLDLDAEGHVRRVSYVPARLPAAAARAGIELVRGPVGPGLWGRERLSITFEGGLGPLQGSFRLSQRVSQHRRFPTVEAALAATPR
ncbi:MAG: hypothetical protein VKS61_03300 [Candidatus Sericytochromatia bacterium]|nr:hypothetical protein [Candidatus Sericytochromatia bacterium]